jgi:hypothetical protein
VENNSYLFNNNNILSILNRRNFYRDVEDLQTILDPIKKAVVILEHRNATLADCFLCLIKLSAIIKEFPQNRNNSFQRKCQLAFDKRWNEFNFEMYLLGYFLHPQFRGKILYNNN